MDKHDPIPFNPLDYENLGVSISNAILNQDPGPFGNLSDSAELGSTSFTTVDQLSPFQLTRHLLIVTKLPHFRNRYISVRRCRLALEKADERINQQELPFLIG
jgi:hypothetical protein